MERAKIFINGRSKAVRLPKSVVFSDDVKEVDIVRKGDMIILRPHRPQWSTFAKDAPDVPDDFLADRRDELPQKRPRLL